MQLIKVSPLHYWAIVLKQHEKGKEMDAKNVKLLSYAMTRAFVVSDWRMSFSLYNPHIESNSQLVHLNRCILVFDYKLRQLFPSFGTLQNVREDDKNDQGSDSIIDEETRCVR